MFTCDGIEQLVRAALPNAEIHVRETVGDGEHFELEVADASFAGKSRVAQHQAVYRALGGAMREEIHALALVTRAL